MCRVKLDSRDMASLATLQGKALFTGTRRAIDADTVYVCSYNDVAHQLKVMACDFACASVVEVNFDKEDAAYFLSHYVCA